MKEVKSINDSYVELFNKLFKYDSEITTIPNNLKEILDSFINKLLTKKHEATIIRSFFGLDGYKKTQKDLADELNITQTRVSQIILAALRKLKNKTRNAFIFGENDFISFIPISKTQMYRENKDKIDTILNGDIYIDNQNKDKLSIILSNLSVVDLYINQLDLSTNTYNSMFRFLQYKANPVLISLILLNPTDQYLLKIRNIGSASLEELKTKINKYLKHFDTDYISLIETLGYKSEDETTYFLLVDKILSAIDKLYHDIYRCIFVKIFLEKSMSNNSSIIKAYKGFNKDMTCLCFQYEEGKEYEIEGELCMCYNGFHACTNPLDVFLYYNPNTSVYHEVELSGDIIRNDEDSKLCASKIKIGKRLDIIKDMIEPNLDTDTEVVKYEGNLPNDVYSTNIAKQPGDVAVSISHNHNFYYYDYYYTLTKGVIGSYLVLYDINRNNFIALKVDGERIKEDCCYRYCNGKIIEYKIIKER